MNDNEQNAKDTLAHPFQMFLSVVFVVRNDSSNLNELLADACDLISTFTKDYEIIVIDNGSDDNSIEILKELTSPNRLPNLQVYALTKTVDLNTASWVGLENALGDFIAVIDPWQDDIHFLPKMLQKNTEGADVVFAYNNFKAKQSIPYSIANSFYNLMYKYFSGIHLSKQAPQFRVLSKRIVNFILQHQNPAVTYRHLPATAGFARVNLSYSSQPRKQDKRRLSESVDKGMRLLVSTTQAPMRIVTILSLFGAAANFFYSIYVVLVAFIKVDVEPGWTSLSLQQSGMFFLISLVLLILGEYVLHMATLSNSGPLYHIAQEFTSSSLGINRKLNIEEPLHRTE